MELFLYARQMKETIGKVRPKITMMVGHFSPQIHFQVGLGGYKSTRREGEMDNTELARERADGSQYSYHIRGSKIPFA